MFNRNNLDELLNPAIKILKRKGFKISFYRSGHIYDDVERYTNNVLKNDKCCIAFDMDKEELLNLNFNIPDGFKLKSISTSINENKYKTIIYKIYDINCDRWIEILDTAKYLYNWAKEI